MSDRALLKLDGIKGQTTAAGHIGEISLLSFSLASQSHHGGTGSKEVTFTKMVDSASSAIFSACANGTPIQTAIVSVAKGDDAKMVDYLVYTMRKLYINSYSTSGPDRDETFETVSMSYEGIEYDYRQP